MAELAHSPLGPSSAERWINCPGSVLETAEVPEQPSRYAAEGTLAHSVSEWCRVQQVSAAKFLGSEHEVDGFKLTVDEEMVDGVNRFCEYVDDLGGQAFYEARVRYDDWVPGGFGTADHVALHPGACDVVDLKYGKGVQVFARDNSQLKLYAAGVLHDFGWLADIERFRLHIVQPRLDFIDTWEVSKKELMQWVHAVVRPAAQQALAPGAPFKAGDWCQFCKIKATCRVRAQTVFETVVGELADLDASEPRTIARLTNEEIAQALTQVANITRWCTDLKTHATGEIMAGRTVGEWKLVAGRSNRQWGRPEEEIVQILHDQGLEEQELYVPRQLLSPPQMEKKLGKDKKEVLKALIVKPQGTPTLAPGDDPRVALPVDALEGLVDLDADEH